MPISEPLAEVLDAQRSYSSDNTPAMQARRQALLRARDALAAALTPAPWAAGLKSEAKDGVGRKSRTPWIRIFHPEVSPRPTSGWYLVFLFRADGTGVYFSLNQGTQIWREGGDLEAQPPSEVRARADRAREQLSRSWEPGERFSAEMDLREPKGGRALGTGYQDGNVYSRFYAREAIPADDELISDAARLAAALAIVSGRARPSGSSQASPQEAPIEHQPMQLKDAIPALHAALEAAGWVFEPWQIAAYVTALRTKPFVILGGVSGTGKSELPGLVNEVIGGAPRTRISVRPDWTDSSDLLGYRDLSNNFHAGALAHAVKNARSDETRFHVCVIDEMNIARVEHYFAEVLSAIEDRGGGDGASGVLLAAHLAERDKTWTDLRIPRNMALVGTVNMDESTFGFSKKVLDRAFTIELSRVDLAKWRRGENPALSAVPIALADVVRARRRLEELSDAPEAVTRKIDQILRILGEVNTLLAPAQLHLGYRSRDEVALFVLNADVALEAFKTSDGELVDPLDLALMMKVLPRISGGSRTVKLSLERLLCWSCARAERASPPDVAKALRNEWVEAGRNATVPGARFPRTAARLCLMWDRIEEEGFTSFWI